MRKSVAWFDRAVKAIGQIADDSSLLGLDDRYICPLCIRGFHRADAANLTLEDAPPRALGGRKVALTCPDCNHSAGFRLDAHMVRQANFERGWQTKPLVSEISIGDVSAKVDLSVAPGEITTANFRKRNSPATSDALARELDRVTGSGGQLTLHIRLDHDSRMAFIGWLKAAYVIAFAAFGYSYILQPELDVVRRQIQEPTASLVADVAGIRREDPQTTRRVGYSVERGELDVVLVQMGTRILFLPGFTPGADLYGALSRLPRDTPIPWKLTEVDWPSEPTHWLDFNERRAPLRLELRSRPPQGVKLTPTIGEEGVR